MPSTGIRYRAAFLGILLLTAGCATQTHTVQKEAGILKRDGKYDNHSYLVDSSKMDLSRVASSIVKLITKTTFKAPDGTRLNNEIEGSGVVVANRYVLTVEHVVTAHGMKIQTPMGVIEPPVEKVAEVTYIRWEGKDHLLKPMYRNQPDDIALFELPYGVNPPSYPYEVGNSDELRVGNYVYVVGNPLNLGINVREGIVSSLKAPSQISQIDAKGENAFMVSNGLVPGDSGTPVIAIRDGKFEMVGLSQGTFVGNTRLGWVIRINAIRGLLHASSALSNESWVAKAPRSSAPQTHMPVSVITPQKSSSIDLIGWSEEGK